MLRGMREEGKSLQQTLAVTGVGRRSALFPADSCAGLEIRDNNIIAEDTSMFVSRLRKPRLSRIRYRFHVCKNVSLFKGFI